MTVSEIELDALAAGDDVKTDLISTKHYQYVKIADGTVDGETVIASGNGGAANALRVTTPDAAVDSNNSTTSTLLANTDYTGTYTDVSAYAGITVSIFADQDSDAAGMKFIFSTDGTNDDMDVAGGFDYLASTGRTFQFPIQAQFFRVQFNNAGTGQGAFRLETLLHKQPVSLTSIHRLDADVVPDRSAELVKAAIVARKAGAGDFVPVQSTNGGNLKISLEEDGSGTLATAANQLPDGHAVTVDNASGASAVNIQDGGNSITVDNGGTFAVQATLDAETTKVIGTVNVSAGQTVGLDAGTNAIGKLAANSGVDIGDVDVTSCALPTGAATAANQVAKATGGMSYHMLAMAAADNDAVIKASAATVYFISVQSIDATPVYLKLFDAASITPGTTAADLQYMCPSQGDANGAGIVLNFGTHGIQFSTGLCALISTGIATTDNTAVSANEVIVTIGYE